MQLIYFQLRVLRDLQKRSRIIWKGVRDCKYENCFIYNPLFNKDGTIPQSLNENSFLVEC